MLMSLYIEEVPKMPEREILHWLKVEDYKKAVEACEASPQSAEGIANLTNLDASRIGEILERLESDEVIVHTSEGWKPTELAIKVLNKYFR